MPYYIYQITEPLLLKYLDQKLHFQEANKMVKKLRQELTPANIAQIRMIFADSIGEAERLLSAPKEIRVISED